MRLANQELLKIGDLKKSVDDEQERAAKRKDEEKDKLMKIESLNEDIAEAKRKALEAHELDEEKQLRELTKQWDDLTKRKEEQDEKKQKHRTDASNLLKQQIAAQKMIESQISTLEKLNSGVIKAREDQNKANEEKTKLDDKTSQLQKEKDQEAATIIELQNRKNQRKLDLQTVEEKCTHEEEMISETRKDLSKFKTEAANLRKELHKAEKDLQRSTSQFTENESNFNSQLRDLREAEKELRKLTK